MWTAPSPSLRRRFVLVIALGVVAPLALGGLWLTRTTRSSAETLLRARLERSLGDAVQTVGHSWVSLRGELLSLSEHPAVRATLGDGQRVAASDDPAMAAAVRETWAALLEVADRVVFHDTTGARRWTLEHAVEVGGRSPARAGDATFPVRLPVHDASSGRLVGSVEVHLRVSSLLPGGLLWPGVGGSILGLFTANGEAPLLPVPMGPELFALDRFTWGGEDWLVVRHRLHEPPLLLALAAPIGPFTQPFSRAARRGALGFAVILTASFVLALWLTRRMTGSLERLARAADAVAGGQLAQRVAEEGPDEIRRLARAFNAMTESLRRTLQKLSQQEASAAVGRFTAALAHEVRNPLTSVRLDLERAREITDDERTRELVERALAEIERLDAVVTGSLRIARSGRLSLVGLDLRAPLEAAAHAAEPYFRERGATLEPIPIDPPSLPVRGDAGALEQLFLNLLRNAAEVLEVGGRAALEIEVRGDYLCISVCDDGPGITVEDLERVMEPFYSTKAEGTGLGLPIARRIAQAHGGDLVIESGPGQGTVVHVLVPLDRQAFPDVPRNAQARNRNDLLRSAAPQTRARRG